MTVHHFQTEEILSTMQRDKQAWKEFLRVPAMSMGIYRLGAGEIDRQSPHTEDEVYYVLAGRADFRLADDAIPVRAGSIIYVEKNAPHRFENIQEDLTTLVFFAPAEHSQRQGV